MILAVSETGTSERVLVVLDRVIIATAPERSVSVRHRTTPASGETELTRLTEAEIDAALVGRFNSGDASAFAEIAERYRERSFAVAFALLRDRADAEEIAQDTLIRAHGALRRFRGDSALSTWMHRITTNLARNRYWHTVRRGRHTNISTDCPLADGGATFSDLISDQAPGPAREAALAEFTELVESCIKQLPSAHREILTMRGILKRSYLELAAKFMIGEGTVKSRLARARGALRALLAKGRPELRDRNDWFEKDRDSPSLRRS